MLQSLLPVRMQDIASAAGCSTMTVSMALRNSPRISSETRMRIANLAEKMGYRPNPLVSALIVRRSKPKQSEADTLAVLTKFDIPLKRWRRNDGFYVEVWKGVEQRAAELGFRIEEFPVSGNDVLDGRRLTRILTTRGIRGLILFPGGGLDRVYPELDWPQFSLVAIGFHGPELPVHRISSNYSHALEIALAELTRRGYRRPGLAMTSCLDPLIRYSISGRFLSWQQSQPRSCRVPLIPGRSIEPERRAFQNWLEKQRPDVILGLEPSILWMKERMTRVRTKTDMVHLAKRTGDPFSGVNLRTANVGRTTVDMLAKELYLNRTGLPTCPELVQVSGRWEDGRTLRR